MDWRNRLEVLAKSLNLSSRQRHWKTAKSFKIHYFARGYKKGYIEAKKSLTSVIEHSYSEKPNFSIVDTHVVSGSKLDFDQEDVKAFFLDVFKGLPQEKRPNSEQVKLIFSPFRNTLSIAGAGSGKTTSLINRLLFLHKQCKVPLEELTVFSFTRASVSDFRSKLIEVFGANGINVSQEKSESIIRTFHSKVLEMSKDSFLKGQFRIFEFMKSSDIEFNDDEDKLYKEAIKKANEEVVAISELNDKQSEMLYMALDKCYGENPDFKKAISSLFLLKLKGEMDDSKTPSMVHSVIHKTNEFERQLAPLMKDFYVLGPQATDGIQISLRNSEYQNLQISSDAYYPRHKLHVVFSPQYKHLKQSDLPGSLSVDGFSQSIYALTKRKAYIAVNYSPDDVRVINDQSDLDALESFLLSLSSTDKSTHEAKCPRFSARFKGDYEFRPLVDVFFDIATFIESIGLSVEHCGTGLNVLRNLKETDKLLLEAVSIYWKTFQQVLAENSIVRFHDLFDSFSTPHSKSFSSLSIKTKRSLSNIIIDEFQDISPEVAKWIKATLITLTQDCLNTSLMCVGDDFQSIYGWRGSSPDYLSNYKARFPSENINQIFMSKNYRSFQSIVDTAESCLQYKRAFNKTGVCENSDNVPRLSFFEVTNKTGNTQVTEHSLNLVADITELLIEDGCKDKDCDLLIMAKTNSVLNVIKEKFKLTPKSRLMTKSGIPLDIRFETFHRSKGLEARYCLLIEDCHYDNEHPAKNYLYKLAGFSKSFDDAQREESMRLAYVAVTRAKEKVWWITAEDSKGSFQLAKAYAMEKGYAF